jgi:hypothetical protein
VNAELCKPFSTGASRYQVVGDIGDVNSESAESGNIGFGLCIGEPSDPRLRLGELIIP